MEELNEKKTKYFVIAIIILIILGVLLIVHFNNKQMVKGEDDKGDTPTTTEKITTTTKKRVTVEEVKEEVVYKSVIDKDNKLVYNYKLTDEITETDVIISKKLEISETLKEKDIIGLFDISLYDANLVKKNVSNSLITIKIPLTEELKAYENYKVVYINDKNEITDEKFEVKVDSDYLEFNTTHLSVFGIIGTKKVVEEEIVDLSKVTVDVKVNDEVVEDVNNILLEKEDKVELVINNINEDCNVYYGLRATGEDDFTYEKYDGTIELEDGINYKLFVKVSNEEKYEVFELSNIGLYDKVYEYDKETELEENIIVGEIESEDETPYDYKDKDKNLDIVIDNITEEVEVTETVNNQEVTDNSATITVNGNIYLVEKTDISELNMTGYLYIDTSEDIVFAQNIEEKIILDNLYSLTIRSKEFSLNGKKYSYEYTPDGDLVIYDLNETIEIEDEQEEVETIVGENTVEEETTENKEISLEKFNELFAGNYEVVFDGKNTDLVIGLIPELVIPSQETSVEEENVSGETKVDVETTTEENVTE